MTPEQFTAKLAAISKELMPDIAEIIAETAAEYYKDSFRRKAFDGKSWARTKKRTGSTLVESSNLMNSIRPVTVTPTQVIIAAGNEKVAYARVHNEGGIVDVRPHSRTSRKGNKYQVRSYGYHAWRRQFMGNSGEMFDIINKRVETYISNHINQ